MVPLKYENRFHFVALEVKMRKPHITYLRGNMLSRLETKQEKTKNKTSKNGNKEYKLSFHMNIFELQSAKTYLKWRTNLLISSFLKTLTYRTMNGSNGMEHANSYLNEYSNKYKVCPSTTQIPMLLRGRLSKLILFIQNQLDSCFCTSLQVKIS